MRFEGKTARLWTCTILTAALAWQTASPASAASIDTTSNQKGRLTSIGNGQMRRFFEYDALGRPARAEHALDGTPYVSATTYGYPQNPDTTAGPGTVPRTLTLPDGERVLYGYDASGAQRMVSSTRPGAVTADAIVADMRRNARGQTVSVTYGNGVVTAHVYRDATDLRLERIQTTAPGLGIVQDYVYGFDADGNVTSLADGVVPSFSATYGYDTLDQLVSMTSNGSSFSYQYDSTGNLTVKEGAVQTYGGAGRGPHALAAAGGVTFAYDFNGNVASSTAGLALEWNSENMATRATVGGVERNRKSFLGEELWKKVEGGVTTLYLPGVRVENGQHRKFFGMMAERSPDGTLKFYHGDHLGSSTVVTDSSRVVVNRIAYMPFGEDRGPRGGSFVPRYQFNFKEKDATGFYDYGARLYNPATGRWLSADSMMDGPSRYAYVSNNPLGSTDPTGHQEKGAFDDAVACRGDADCIRGMQKAHARTGKAALKAAGNALPETISFGFWSPFKPVDDEEALLMAGLGIIIPSPNPVDKINKGVKVSKGMSMVFKVGSRHPRNARKVLEKGDGVFHLKGTLAKRYPNGVRFTPTGYPDFSPYAVKRATVRMTDSPSDFSAANMAAGFGPRTSSNVTIDGVTYTWHHHHDKATMLLIPQDLHDAVKHTGGASRVRHGGPSSAFPFP